MTKLIRVQHLQSEVPILYFNKNTNLRDAAIFAACIFRKYLTNYEKYNRKITARNTTIASGSSYGIFIEEGKNPVFEIVKTEKNNQYVLRNIIPFSDGENISINKGVLESYFENNRNTEI